MQVQVMQQYSKGKSTPVILDAATGQPLRDGTLHLAAGCDTGMLQLLYTPQLEDSEGLLGGISLLCRLGSLLLKAELAVTGKPYMLLSVAAR